MLKNYEMKQHTVSNRLIRDMSSILRYYLVTVQPIAEKAEVAENVREV
ncbi:MAG: hypothetical protein JETT_1822 [Candidatus Jettenia ecosi]|uniref:Integrase n=1 Tax=Candidatus Jettenia ecosi TaxID=2494326 RepID=A0A533QGU0_9BACT|nr:MAG: hypothetical protein JETT_1822 [Candidatus Jettenia ecosi]